MSSGLLDPNSGKGVIGPDKMRRGKELAFAIMAAFIYEIDAIDPEPGKLSTFQVTFEILSEILDDADGHLLMATVARLADNASACVLGTAKRFGVEPQEVLEVFGLAAARNDPS